MPQDITIRHDKHGNEINRVPVNRMARIHTQPAKDEELFKYNHNQYGNQYVSNTPIPTQLYNGRKIHDLTNHISGKMKVVGFFDSKKRSGKKLRFNTRWVCLCTCGNYQVLTAKAINKKRTESDILQCEKCKKDAAIARRASKSSEYRDVRDTAESSHASEVGTD